MEKAKNKKHSSTESTAPVIAFEMCLVFSFIFEKRFHSVAQVGLDFFFHLSASASKGFEFRHTSQDPAMGTISHASCVYMVGHTFQRTVKQLNLIGSELYL